METIVDSERSRSILTRASFLYRAIFPESETASGMESGKRF